MSKQLETLISKALRSGFANVNGRQSYGYGYKGDLESKYSVEYDQETGEMELTHWGTTILKIGSLKGSRPQVRYFYGQSKSDRDALAFVFSYLELYQYSVSYRPSIDEFSVTADFGDGQIVTKTV